MPYTLPVELQEKVIDELEDDFQALLNLSRTCRQLLPRARYHLLSTLLLRTRERIQSFCEFLDSNPRYKPLVYRVTIAFDQNQYVKTHTLAELVPIPLLTLPNLRQWRISGAFGPHLAICFNRGTLAAFRKYGSSIQKLDITSLCFASLVDFANTVGMFPALRELSCRQFWYSRTGSEVALARAKRCLSEQLYLKTLTVTLMKASVNQAAVALLLESTASSVENVHLELNQHIDNRQLGLIISQLSRLRSLWVLLALPGEENELNSIIGKATELLGAVRSCKSLETLNIKFNILSLSSFACHVIQNNCLPLCHALDNVLLDLPLEVLWVIASPSKRPGATKIPFWEMTLGRAFQGLHRRGILKVMSDSVIDSEPASYAYSPTANSGQSWLAERNSDDSISIWEITPNFRQVTRLDSHKVHGELRSMGWSPDGSILAAVSCHQIIHIWSTPSFQLLHLVMPSYISVQHSQPTTAKAILASVAAL